MRTFTRGTGAGLKFVRIEVKGRRMRVTQGKADGTTQRSEKELKDEAEARSASDLMARELASRGYLEDGPAVVAEKVESAKAPRSRESSRAASRSPGLGEVNLAHVFEDDGDSAPAEPALRRLAVAPASGAAADGATKPKTKKGGGKKKKRKNGETEGGLDKRVIGVVAAVGVLVVGVMGVMFYDAFLKPASIVGVWAGSKLEFETGGPMSHTEYRLVLDEKKRASMTLQSDFTSTGTYSLQGDLLKLSIKDEDGDRSDIQYKVVLGSATLDLFDPSSGKKVVQLVRFRDKPVVGGEAPAPEAAPKEVAGAAGGVDEDAEAKLASVNFSPKDNAFKIKHPPGWSPETGSRPDNTYSWARFIKGSAKIQVFADVSGSLMSGSDSAGQHEEGSESAPVHSAHTLYKKSAEEEFSDFKEGKPILFKGAPSGEGRVSIFTASGGGLFGSKLRGYHVTLLTRDRRVTLLCACPESDFAKLGPTFLAVARSVSP